MRRSRSSWSLGSGMTGGRLQFPEASRKVGGSPNSAAMSSALAARVPDADILAPIREILSEPSNRCPLISSWVSLRASESPLPTTLPFNNTSFANTGDKSPKPRKPATEAGERTSAVTLPSNLASRVGFTVPSKTVSTDGVEMLIRAPLGSPFRRLQRRVDMAIGGDALAAPGRPRQKTASGARPLSIRSCPSTFSIRVSRRRSALTILAIPP